MNHKTMRKETLALGIVALLSGSLAVAGGTDRVVVTPKATSDALINPGMGWVYYHFDNSNWNYGGETEPGDTLDWFPLRLDRPLRRYAAHRAAPRQRRRRIASLSPRHHPHRIPAKRARESLRYGARSVQDGGGGVAIGGKIWYHGHVF